MRKIAITNLKGGVGKTTMAVNLMIALSKKKKSCLLIDIDPQQNATSHLGVDLSAPGVDAFFKSDKSFDDVVRIGNNYDMMPAGPDLVNLENDWNKQTPASFMNFKNAFKGLTGYDFVLIDCPPHLGVFTVAVLTYCSEVIIPVKCDYFSLEGLGKMTDAIDAVKNEYNPGLNLTAIVPNFYDVRNSISDYMVSELRQNFKKELTKAKIRINVALAEAPAYGQDVFNYKPKSHGASDFKLLADEIIKRGK